MDDGPHRRGELYLGLDREGASGAERAGPPFVLGHRGAPREAPENTLASLRRALDIGLDGVEYDVRAAGDGELVLMHDERLERTTDRTGALAALDVRGLHGVDAGSWFAKRFAGEPVPLLDEALELGSERGDRVVHMIELKETDLVDELAARLATHTPSLDVRVACFRRDVCLAARDAGLPAMLLSVEANEDDRRFVRDERLAAYSVGPGGWDGEVARADWSFCERWAWAIDDPNELLRLARLPLFGFNTNEPHRALAARALAQLAPEDTGRWPLEVGELFVEPEALDDATRKSGEWFGRWSTGARVRNPFTHPIEVRLGFFVPHGAFDVAGLPTAFDLAPGEARDVPFDVTGGSRLPGPDPLVAALLSWDVGTTGPGGEITAGGRLLVDAPLVRRRVMTVDGLVRRLPMLDEQRGDAPASLTIRRARREIVVGLERDGGLEDAHVVARLGREVVRGGGGVRLLLPADFDSRPVGVPFSAGIEGVEPGTGERRIRRWAGGLPEGLGHGSPGLIVPEGRG